MNGLGGREAAEEAVLRAGREIFDAIRRKDAAALGQLVAQDFVHRAHDGAETGREEFLRGVASMPLEVVSVGGEHLRVSVYGEVAVMTGVQRAEWRQGEEAAGISSVAFADVFALRGGAWLLVLAYGVELPD
jgi:ketosteroid isomerase-like protein